MKHAGIRLVSSSIYPIEHDFLLCFITMTVGIIGVVTSQITSLTNVYSTVYSDADQRKHQSSASLAFVREFTGEWHGKCFHLVTSSWSYECPSATEVILNTYHFITVTLNEHQNIPVDLSLDYLFNIFVPVTIKVNVKGPHYRHFVRGIHLWPLYFPHKRTVTRKAFPCFNVMYRKLVFIWGENVYVQCTFTLLNISRELCSPISRIAKYFHTYLYV